MLDQFVWGSVRRISPEAPVPVVEFERESFMPGGAANVARNLTALDVPTDLIGVIGADSSGEALKTLLSGSDINCRGVIKDPSRLTSVKTRVVANQQQVVRIDRESRDGLSEELTRQVLRTVTHDRDVSAIIIGDYGKGVVTQRLLTDMREFCRRKGIWLSVDPKPVHRLDLSGLSLITPNRKETFELAHLTDTTQGSGEPLRDTALMEAVSKLLHELAPAFLLVTLGEHGMLLCQRNSKPVHIPTMAQEVFDVSGAGDTVIATFTMAVAAEASPLEAAMLSNLAAGIVVGKIGTATVTAGELLDHL
jgi:D-beta-D-heptose 7-phosphate kinase/D-beta-D-heptose 1-phosphate adenosyltransferase